MAKKGQRERKQGEGVGPVGEDLARVVGVLHKGTDYHWFSTHDLGRTPLKELVDVGRDKRHLA